MAPPQKWTDKKRKELCEKIEACAAEEDTVYTGGLAGSVGMTANALNQLAKDYPDDVGISFTLCKDIIEKRIIAGSMSKKYDGSFAKFLLSAKHGFIEKTQQTLNVQQIESVQDFGE